MVTFIIGHVIKVMTMLITLYDTVQENKTLIYDKNLKNNKSSGCNELTIELSKILLEGPILLHFYKLYIKICSPCQKGLVRRCFPVC